MPPVRLVRLILTLGMTQLAWTLAMDMYLPAFPQIRTDFGTSTALVQATLTGALLGMVGGQLLTGPISDAVGRKRPLLMLLGMHALASVVCATAPAIGVLIAGRVMQGMASASVGILVIATLRDRFTGRDFLRMAAHIAMVNGVGVVLAPSLGALLLVSITWRGLFWCLSLYAVVALALVSTLPESHFPAPGQRRSFSTVAAAYRVLASDRVYLALLASSALVWASMFAYLSASSFLFQGIYALNPGQYALVFASHGVLTVVGSQLSARLARRFDPRRVLLAALTGTTLGVALMLGSVLLLPHAGVLGLLFPLWLFTTALGMYNPASNAMALHAHQPRAATAASLIGVANAGLGACVSPLPGALGTGTALPTVAIMLTALVLALGIFLLFVPPALPPSRSAGRSTVPGT